MKNPFTLLINKTGSKSRHQRTTIKKKTQQPNKTFKRKQLTSTKRSPISYYSEEKKMVSEKILIINKQQLGETLKPKR